MATLSWLGIWWGLLPTVPFPPQNLKNVERTDEILIFPLSHTVYFLIVSLTLFYYAAYAPPPLFKTKGTQVFKAVSHSSPIHNTDILISTAQVYLGGEKSGLVKRIKWGGSYLSFLQKRNLPLQV